MKGSIFGSDTLFARFMNTLADVIFIGILWVVCSIPVLTAGASATAAYYTMLKCVKHKTGYIGREFFHSFKSNFKQTLPMTCILLLAAVILAVDICYVWQNDSTLNSALFVILTLVSFLVCGLALYLFPLLSRFDKKNSELVKIAFVVLFRYLPITIAGLALFVLAGIGIYLMPWAILVIPGGYIYLMSYPMERILKKLMPPVEEDSEEAQKWYYQ